MTEADILATTYEDTVTVYRAFKDTRPEVDIQTNDFLVITHFGKKIEAVAGFPECMKSHNNIPVKLDKETV